jgi:hypothetical protein
MDAWRVGGAPSPMCGAWNVGVGGPEVAVTPAPAPPQTGPDCSIRQLMHRSTHTNKHEHHNDCEHHYRLPNRRCHRHRAQKTRDGLWRCHTNNYPQQPSVRQARASSGAGSNDARLALHTVQGVKHSENMRDSAGQRHVVSGGCAAMAGSLARGPRAPHARHGCCWCS